MNYSSEIDCADLYSDEGELTFPQYLTDWGPYRQALFVWLIRWN